MPRRPLLDGKPDKLSTEPAQTVCEIPLADIEIGERHRREMGNIAELAQNIAEIGLLHPIVVTPPAQGGRQQLIAGARRFHAYHMLGWDRIPGNGSRSRSNRSRRIRRKLLPQGVHPI